MKIHFIHVTVLGMTFFLGPDGQDIKKNIQYGKRMLDALIDIVHGVSFIECTEDCNSRRRCLSVNYWRGILLCEMNSVNTSSHSLSDEPRTVFANIALLEQQIFGGCSDRQCAINMECVPGPLGNHGCEISDCGPLPSLKNSLEVKSNGQILTIGIGSLRIFQCYPWVYERKYRQKFICQSNGNWTHLQNATCDLVTCATDVTSFETLNINSEKIEVPYVYSKGYKWIVIQRRCFDNTDFYRLWSDYKAGFGNFKEKSDFWIGNDAIHMLTKNGYNYMKIEMLKTDNELIEVEYKYFFVGDEHTEYNLTINGFTGLYDCLSNNTNERINANGMKFTTIDADNDLWESGICANKCKSGWWFNFCTCGNINGLFGNEKTSSVSEMRWRCPGSKHCILKATRMLIRS